MLITMMDMMTILTMIYKEELTAGWERLSVLAKLVDLQVNFFLCRDF